MVRLVAPGAYAAATFAPIGSSTQTFAAASVDTSIAVLKLSITAWPSGTPTSFGEGAEALTLGAFETVNDASNGCARPMPDGSFTAAVRCTEMTAPPGKAP